MPASRAIIELPDRYQPIRHIANGGMASVWAAHDTLLDREVAIKLLAPHLAENERARARFQREARLAAGLSAHPNAVTIYDVGECHGRSFIVMEAMPGGSLADRVREGGRVPREQALEWLGQAARALDAAHERGMVHRDVKPGNMLFDEQGRLVIADFGIARLAYDPTITTTGEVLGTAAYVSPEQADGRPATSASDRYSLAVVAYELLTGTRPFRAEHFAATARQHIEVAPEPPSSRDPSLPAAVDGVLLRALSKSPGERYPSGEALVSALSSALAASGETQTVPLAGPVTGTAPPSGELRGASVPAPPARRSAAASPGRAAGPSPPRAAGSPLRRETDPFAPASRPAKARPRPRRALVLGGLALAALVAVVVAAIASSGGGELKARGVVADKPRKERSSRTSTSSSSPTSTTTQPSSTSTTTTSTPTSTSASSGSGESAAALNSQGYALMNQGRYGEAVPVLQRAAQACGNDVQDLACAYATYNLGRSLRLAGRPGEAVPVLERRLQNPDQRATVQAELDQARAAAGQSDAGNPGKGPKPGKGAKGK
jgi:eukaryotic-like serine/threonine-protein kinase